MPNKKEISDFKPIIICIALQIAITLVMVALLALIMNFAEIDYKYSPVCATVSVAVGVFADAFCLSSKKGSKGLFHGLIIGFSTFVLVTLVGLILNNGAIGINTLFHLIIFVLSGLIGGVLGVNKKPKSFI